MPHSQARRAWRQPAARNTVILLAAIALLGILGLHLTAAHLAEVASIGRADPAEGLRQLARLAMQLGALGLLVVLAGGSWCIARGRQLLAVLGAARRPGRSRGHVLIGCGLLLWALGAGGLGLGVWLLWQLP